VKAEVKVEAEAGQGIETAQAIPQYRIRGDMDAAELELELELGLRLGLDPDSNLASELDSNLASELDSASDSPLRC
jgi:hypothetical protein